MKKFVAVLSAAAMMTSLAACGYTADTANIHYTRNTEIKVT